MSQTLNQGKEFNNYQAKYKNLIKNSNLNLISIGKLNIVNNLRNFKSYKNIEGMSSNPLIKNIETVNQAELKKLEELEIRFNKDRKAYVDNYKLYLEELVSRNTSLNTAHKNKVMKYQGTHYWINNAGTARSFDASSWLGKDNSCPDSAGNLSGQEFSKLTRGPPMGQGELCTSGGFSAKDGGSGTTAWVDNQGYKYVYSDFINKHPSCPNQTRTLSSIQFHAIPTRRSYGRNDRCETVSLDSPLHDKLMALNNKLMTTITEMKSLVGSISSKDNEVQKKVKDQKGILIKKYRELQKEKARVMKLKRGNDTLIAEIDEQQLDSSAIQMHHFIWAIIGGAFVYTALIQFNKN